jgi:hypothetical protein
VRCSLHLPRIPLLWGHGQPVSLCGRLVIQLCSFELEIGQVCGAGKRIIGELRQADSCSRRPSSAYACRRASMRESGGVSIPITGTTFRDAHARSSRYVPGRASNPSNARSRLRAPVRAGLLHTNKGGACDQTGGAKGN